MPDELESFLDSPAEPEEKGEVEIEETNEEESSGSDSGEESEGEGDGESEDSEEGKEESSSNDDDSEDDEELRAASPVPLDQIKKKYPNLFKEYPALKNTIIREDEFTHIFPTLEEAREAYDRSESFRNFQSELASGQSVNLLQNIDKLDKRAFDRFTMGFLDAVARVNPQQHNKILWTPITRFLKHVFGEGSKHNNKDLVLATRHLTHYLTNGKENMPEKLEEPTVTREDQDSDERTRLNRERSEFFKQRQEAAFADIESQLDKLLVKEVEDGLDPNNRLSRLEKDALVDKIIRELNQTLGKNERHTKSMKAMWERAHNAGYPAEWQNRIRDQVLSSMRRLLPDVRQKHRAEAFKALKAGKAPNNNVATGRAAGGSRTNGSGSTKGPRKIDYSKTSDADIFAGNIKYKK